MLSQALCIIKLGSPIIFLGWRALDFNNSCVILKTMLAVFSLASGSLEKERGPGYAGIIISRTYTVEALFVPFWTPASAVCPIWSTQCSYAPLSVTLFSQEQPVTFFCSFFAMRQGLISTKIFSVLDFYYAKIQKMMYFGAQNQQFLIFLKICSLRFSKTVPDNTY